jgi:asparagine synthase (glutamine-hydrolysing)
MCGIAAIIDRTGVLTEEKGTKALQDMLTAMAHRGPDESAWSRMPFGKAGSTSLGVNRLALRGGNEGAQPYKTHSTNYKEHGMLAYNGDIPLSSFDETLIKVSDTVALASWLTQEANEYVALEGMYAFIWARPSKVLLRRDAFGIKPLYYAPTQFGYIVASEVAALFASGLIGVRVLRPEALAEQAKYRAVASPNSWYTGVYVLIPGGVLEITPEEEEVLLRKETTKEISHQSTQVRPGGSEDFVSYATALKEATRACLQSNTGHSTTGQTKETKYPQTGLMLSGGVDSALLALLAAQYGQKLHCYTIAGSPEEEAAKAIAGKLGHLFTAVTPSATELIPYLSGQIEAGNPVADPAGFLTYTLAKQARKDGIAALLSGIGADELLLGYRRHRAVWYYEHTPALLRPLAGNAIRLMAGLKKGLVAERDEINRLSRVFAYPCERFYSALLETRLPELIGGGRNTQDVDSYTDFPSYERFRYLSAQLLPEADFAAMQAGVEVRVPYLYRSVWDAVWQGNGVLKRPWGTKKASIDLLKEGGIADLLVKGPKRGFGFWDGPIGTYLLAWELPEGGHGLYTYFAKPEMVACQNEARRTRHYPTLYHMLQLSLVCERVLR